MSLTADLSAMHTIDPLADPGKANALTSQMLAAPSTPEPVIDPPADGCLTLAAGILREGVAVRDALVRELNGADEEALARVKTNPARYLATLLQRGVAAVGGQAPTPALLGELLLGDQESLVLAIRRVTFGSEVPLENLTCPHCGDRANITIHLDQIPVRELADPAQREFRVELRQGRAALVRLPNVADQERLLTASGATDAEYNTLLLSRCVRRVVEADGSEHRVDARSLGAADRAKIIAFFAETQPGPRYEELKFNHDACGKDVSIPMTLSQLFRDLGL